MERNPFYFEIQKAEIVYIAELDTRRSHVYAKEAVKVIFEDYKEMLSKGKLMAFPRYCVLYCCGGFDIPFASPEMNLRSTASPTPEQPDFV